MHASLVRSPIRDIRVIRGSPWILFVPAYKIDSINRLLGICAILRINFSDF